MLPTDGATVGGVCPGGLHVGVTRTGALVSLLVQHSVSGGGKGWPPWPGPDPRGEPAGLHRGL